MCFKFALLSREPPSLLYLSLSSHYSFSIAATFHSRTSNAPTSNPHRTVIVAPPFISSPFTVSHHNHNTLLLLRHFFHSISQNFLHVPLQSVAILSLLDLAFNLLLFQPSSTLDFRLVRALNLSLKMPSSLGLTSTGQSYGGRSNPM